MADKQELQKKVGYFAKSVSRYSRAKKLVWGCGIGLWWALVCVLFATARDISWRNSEWPVQIAFVIIVVVACIVTHFANNALRKEITAYATEMKKAGYSYSDLCESLIAAALPTNTVKECLFEVFDEIPDGKLANSAEFWSNVGECTQRKRRIYRWWLWVYCVVVAATTVFLFSEHLSYLHSPKINGDWMSGLEDALLPLLVVPLVVILAAVTGLVVAFLQVGTNNKRFGYLEKAVQEMKDKGASRDEVKKYLERYPVNEEVDVCLKSAFAKKD